MWPPELVNSAAAASAHGATRSPSPGWPRGAGRPRVRATTGGLRVGAPGGGPPPRGSGGSAAAGRDFPAAAHFLNPRPAPVQGQGGGGDSLHIWPRRALPRADPLLRAVPGLDSATVTAGGWDGGGSGATGLDPATQLGGGADPALATSIARR